MVAKAPVPGNWVGGVRDRGRECVCEREKERRGGGREREEVTSPLPSTRPDTGLYWKR